MSWDALVLAGGAARRLGGVDKPALTVGGQTLLDRVLAAVDGAREVIVVGPARRVAVTRPVRWTRERPPGGGPVAALAAGLELVCAPLVAVLAADLPFLTAATVAALVRAVGGGGAGAGAGRGAGAGAGRDATGAGRTDDDPPWGALLVDPAGRHQYLTGVWRTSALRARLPAVPAGASMRSVLAGPRVLVLPADGRTTLDCDAPADLERARGWARMGP
ncbi:molybdenum cofactor guanylyltransferase [Frankia sp. Cr1]|uniref:molybdenum cofactor guanylyltransferase n=1 Tax=Frankia sp. Cr1 TaxID=3073931 RepID=UPI002AD4A376|nr:NTP transferase domain-containing protein [Frankia sp. Cr1]